MKDTTPLSFPFQDPSTERLHFHGIVLLFPRSLGIRNGLQNRLYKLRWRHQPTKFHQLSMHAFHLHPRVSLGGNEGRRQAESLIGTHTIFVALPSLRG